MGLGNVFFVYDSLWLFIVMSIQQKFLHYTMYNQVSNVSYFDTSSI